MNKYYHWLVNIVCNRYHAKYYTSLLHDLYEREFIWSINRDEDRAIDGISLRKRYLDEVGHCSRKDLPPNDAPCSVLEMMAALSIRIEEDYMHDARSDIDNTTEWFWVMIINLGLDKNDDIDYDADLTDACLTCFLERRYRRDGKGGLFMVAGLHKDYDMATLDIWSQMNWYISMYESCSLNDLF